MKRWKAIGWSKYDIYILYKSDNNGTHCTPDPSWKEGSPTLQDPSLDLWGGGGVITIHPAMPFETDRTFPDLIDFSDWQ